MKDFIISNGDSVANNTLKKANLPHFNLGSFKDSNIDGIPSNDNYDSLKSRIEELEAKLQQVSNSKPKKKNKKKKNKKKHSLQKFAKEYIDHIKSYGELKYIISVELTLRHLLDCLGKGKNISKIDRSDVNAVIAKLKATAPKGYRVYFRNLKAAFNVALQWKYINSNPFEKVKLPKKQKVLPAYIFPDQLELIIDNMDNVDLKEIVYFAFYTGCRRNEILNLRWKDIDLKKKNITIGNHEYTTKTKSQRIVPIPDNLLTMLEKRLASRTQNNKKDDSFVFSKPNGFPFHEDVPSKAFKSACRKAGIDERIHFHSLRHSFASYHVSNGTELYVVRDLLGHSSVTTTEIYSHLDTKSIQNSTKVFENMTK